jgi:tRNA(fMet)-specific endonuclease VapC
VTRARPATPAGLLDTSVVIALPITLAELSVGPLATDDPDERAARQAVLQAAEATFDPLPFDAACARAFDTPVAATAIAHGLPLITANARDVAGIPGLDVRGLELTDAP